MFEKRHRITLLFNANKAYDRQVVEGVGEYLQASQSEWDIFIEEDFRTRIENIKDWLGDGVIAMEVAGSDGLCVLFGDGGRADEPGDPAAPRELQKGAADDAEYGGPEIANRPRVTGGHVQAWLVEPLHRIAFPGAIVRV